MSLHDQITMETEGRRNREHLSDLMSGFKRGMPDSEFFGALIGITICALTLGAIVVLGWSSQLVLNSIPFFPFNNDIIGVCLMLAMICAWPFLLALPAQRYWNDGRHALAVLWLITIGLTMVTPMLLDIFWHWPIPHRPF